MDDAEIVDLDWVLRAEELFLQKKREGCISTVERCNHSDKP